MRSSRRDPVARLEAEVAGFLRAHGRPASAASVLGFSGGPDSTALLAALAALGRAPTLAVYVDHGLRPEGERLAERRLVLESGDRFGVPVLAREAAGIRDLAILSGSGVEAAARQVRQGILREEMARIGADLLYLGHNQDDSLETILMRFFGGSGAGGLGGIAVEGEGLLRPLSGLSKAEILAYLEARGLPYSRDSTNESGAFLRNRIRNSLVPLLDAEFSGWRNGLLRGAEKARLEESALAARAEAIGFTGRPETGLSCDEEAFLGEAEAVRLRALLLAFSRLDETSPEAGRFSGGRVSSAMAREALRALEGGRSFEGHGFRAERRDGLVKLARSLDFSRVDGYFVALTEYDVGRERVLSRGISLESRWDADSGGGGLPEGSFVFPLIIRSRRAGDRILLPGGGKAVDRIMSDLGLPPESRDRIPLVQDRRGIVALLCSTSRGGPDVLRVAGSSEGGGDRPGRFLSLIVKGA